MISQEEIETALAYADYYTDEKTYHPALLKEHPDQGPGETARILATAYRDMKNKLYEEIRKGRERTEGIMEIAIKDAEARTWEKASEICWKSNYNMMGQGVADGLRGRFKELAAKSKEGLQEFTCKMGSEGE